ncbi:hypothetical protein [Kitasatospora sp. NPDC047058]|uniref:hypothetical protein n=1 Tax=Kitasatospora sp. NPDC047058 TaxID=3155620 RepID=UPI0033D5022F
MLPLWLPPYDTVHAIQAGIHWDAICLPQQVGLATLAVLDITPPGPGPTIWDTRRDPRLYLLTPVTDRPDLTGTPGRHLTHGSHLAVPGPELLTPPGLHWIVPPTPDALNRLNDLATVVNAIRRALGASWVTHRIPGQPDREILATHSQIHGTACINCSTDGTTLRPAGHVYTPALGGCGYAVTACTPCLDGALQ